MQAPHAHTHPLHKVFQFRHVLYGLKQAPCAWFAKFNSTITHIGLVSSFYDFALFIQRSNAGLIFLLVYVDDMIIINDDTTGIHELQ